MPDIHANLLLQDLSSALNALRSGTDVNAHRQLLDQLKAAPKEWGESRKCVYPGCAKNSIRRSHTVQDAALARSFGPMPVTPKWSDRSGGFEVVQSSVKSLSVFPGYCSEDEKKFPFEDRGWFEDDHDDTLQLMRTCHREIWHAEKRRQFAGEVHRLWKDIASVGRGQPEIETAATARADAFRDYTALQSSMIVRLRPLARRLEDAAISGVAIPSSGIYCIDLDHQPFAFHSAVKLDTNSAALLLIALVPNGDRSRLLVAIEPGFEHELSA